MYMMKGRCSLSQCENKEKLDDLEMAKKRDHKIMITDEAIKKIPFIQYREIPENQYHILQTLAKEVLTVSKEKNHSNEVAITYSLAGIDEFSDSREDIFGISLGDEHSVDPEEDSASYHILNGTTECVVIIMHNHPSLSKLSLTDVQFLLQYHTMKMIVAVTNQGSISYLVKAKGYNRTRAVKLFNDAFKKHSEACNLKERQEAAEYFLNNCYDVGIIYDDR